MGTVTKKNLIDHVSNLTGHKRHDVKDVIQTFLEQMIEELGHGNRLEFRDFGVFEIKRRAPRVAQNPRTLQPVAVPPKNTVKFKVGRLMKERLDDTHVSGSAAREMSVNGTDGSAALAIRPVRPRRVRETALE
ncbi:MAG: integration host factor subunit beta [Pyrinomonadaceae bacterium]|nr:integration host factor subunit beta [Phycisphaerales bacterium]